MHIILKITGLLIFIPDKVFIEKKECSLENEGIFLVFVWYVNVSVMWNGIGVNFSKDRTLYCFLVCLGLISFPNGFCLLFPLILYCF